jgi:3-hydroxyacyl-[acyl-carrier-protein] dehydratase
MISAETPDIADITEIFLLLPHRYPFLLIDRVIDIRGEDHGIGIKKLTMNELQFGRSAENPVMPGVLVMPAGISTYMSHSSAKRSSKRSKKAVLTSWKS